MRASLSLCSLAFFGVVCLMQAGVEAGPGYQASNYMYQSQPNYYQQQQQQPYYYQQQQPYYPPSGFGYSQYSNYGYGRTGMGMFSNNYGGLPLWLWLALGLGLILLLR